MGGDAALIVLSDEGLSAGISPLGAELQWLRDADGHDLLWDGDPAYWNGRAPILFPIVGAVAGGVIRVGGSDYPLPRHGFARRRTFALVEQDSASARFRLEADAETRAVYPFDFRLDVVFTVAGGSLEIRAELTNPGEAALPASFGYHPAFRWPLPYGRPRADHLVRFESGEPAPVRRLDAKGLLRAEALPTPVVDRTLSLDDALFADDALILDRPVSRRVVYGAPGAPGIEVAYPDMPMLGIWTKPGAPFLCIEPWAGIADPADFAGDFADKPGVVAVAPGATRTFTMRIALVPSVGDA